MNQTDVVSSRTQQADLKNKEKILIINKLMQAYNPAFVVTSPGIFNTLRNYHRLLLVSKQGFKNLVGEIYICKLNLPQTIFISLPHHLSRC